MKNPTNLLDCLKIKLIKNSFLAVCHYLTSKIYFVRVNLRSIQKQVYINLQSFPLKLAQPQIQFRICNRCEIFQAIIFQVISHLMSVLTAIFFYPDLAKASFTSLTWIFISHSVGQDLKKAAALRTFRIQTETSFVLRSPASFCKNQDSVPLSEIVETMFQREKAKPLEIEAPARFWRPGCSRDVPRPHLLHGPLFYQSHVPLSWLGSRITRDCSAASESCGRGTG